MTFSAVDSALVGPLFATEAMRDCFGDRARLHAMLAAVAALAQAEAALGLVPEGLAEAVAAIAPEELDAPAIGRGTVLSAVPTIPFVKAVQARLPPELERGFHRGATTQDILDTKLVLQLRPALDLVAGEAGAILEALAALVERYQFTPCVDRSYGQHAAPLSFGYKVAVWLAGIAEVAAVLPALRKRLLVASLGGPVGTLAGLGAQGPAVLQRFAQKLGLGADPIAWHGRRARVAEAGCRLAQMIGALAKMVTDVANLASTEVGEVAEPYQPGRGGFSAMPRKRNPVACTVILSAHAAAPGQAAALLSAMAVAHERPVGLWQAEWHALPPLFGLLSGALREARVLAEGLEVDVGRMRRNIDLTQVSLFANAAARLAAVLGREAAHGIVEQVAGAVRGGQGDLRTVLDARAEVRGAGIDLGPAFALEPPVEAAAGWVDGAVTHSRGVASALGLAGGGVLEQRKED